MEHKMISLADQVFERLETEILSGRYQAGELLTEARLSDDLGVSRTPVREALRRLEQEHIVELSSKGILVLGVSPEDILDIYALRLRIEGLVVAAAAKNRTEKQLNDLREALELQEYYVSRHDADHIKYMDSQFHELVYEMSGSVAFYDALAPLHKKVQKYRKANVQNETRAEHSLAEHRAMYEAILRGDSKEAERVATEHVENAMKNIGKKEG